MAGFAANSQHRISRQTALSWSVGFAIGIAFYATVFSRSLNLHPAVAWLAGFVTTAFFVTFAWFLQRMQYKMENRDIQLRAASALRFEMEQDLRMLPTLHLTQIWLREDAFNKMRVEGYLGYLKHPLPSMILDLYFSLYSLHAILKRYKDGQTEYAEFTRDFDPQRATFAEQLQDCITAFDQTYPEIARNFVSGASEQVVRPEAG